MDVCARSTHPGSKSQERAASSHAITHPRVTPGRHPPHNVWQTRSVGSSSSSSFDPLFDVSRTNAESILGRYRTGRIYHCVGACCLIRPTELAQSFCKSNDGWNP